MFDLLKQHFDKLLLTFFVLYFSLLGFHSIFYLTHHDGTIASNPIVQGFMAAMLDNQKLIIGALLGLITGKALASTGGKDGTTTVSSSTTDSTSSSH
jgi:hypothetical protein